MCLSQALIRWGVQVELILKGKHIRFFISNECKYVVFPFLKRKHKFSLMDHDDDDDECDCFLNLFRY